MPIQSRQPDLLQQIIDMRERIRKLEVGVAPLKRNIPGNFLTNFLGAEKTVTIPASGEYWNYQTTDGFIDNDLFWMMQYGPRPFTSTMDTDGLIVDPGCYWLHLRVDLSDSNVTTSNLDVDQIALETGLNTLSTSAQIRVRGPLERPRLTQPLAVEDFSLLIVKSNSSGQMRAGSELVWGIHNGLGVDATDVHIAVSIARFSIMPYFEQPGDQ